MPTYNKVDRKLIFSSQESQVNRCPVCGAEPDYEPFQLIDSIIKYPWRCHKCGATGHERSDVEFNAQCVDVDSLPPDIRGEYVELKTNCINGPLGVGDLVLSTAECAGFPCLPGRVTKLHLLGSEKHDTQNESDDVYVDFRGCYKMARKREIVSAFTPSYEVPPAFEDIRLDNIIMSPGSLLNISDITATSLEAVMEKEENAIRYAYHVVRNLLAA